MEQDVLYTGTMTVRQALLMGPFLIALLCGLAFGIFVLRPMPVSAQGSGSSTLFGGKIESIWYCTCSMGVYLEIGEPKSANVIVQFGQSMIYPYGQVFMPNPWTLGNYSSGGECDYYVGEGCDEYGDPDGTVNKVGTSL